MRKGRLSRFRRSGRHPAGQSFTTAPPSNPLIKLHAQHCAPRSWATARAHEVFAPPFHLLRRGGKPAHPVFLPCFSLAKKISEPQKRFGNPVFTLQKRSGIHWGARLSGFSKKSKNFHFSTYKRPLSNHRNFGHNNSARLRCAVFLAFFDVLFGASPNEFRSEKEGFFRVFLQIQTGTFEPPRNWTPFFTSSDETCQG